MRTLISNLQVLHYGVECFEGMKAYKGKDGRLRLFRPNMNMDRLARSASRLTLPHFDKVCFVFFSCWFLKSVDLKTKKSSALDLRQLRAKSPLGTTHSCFDAIRYQEFANFVADLCQIQRELLAI